MDAIATAGAGEQTVAQHRAYSVGGDTGADGASGGRRPRPLPGSSSVAGAAAAGGAVGAAVVAVAVGGGLGRGRGGGAGQPPLQPPWLPPPPPLAAGHCADDDGRPPPPLPPWRPLVVGHCAGEPDAVTVLWLTPTMVVVVAVMGASGSLATTWGC